ncbi:MAG TPA: hypothetical protein VGE76_04400 [Opitutaceae bacterium]
MNPLSLTRPFARRLLSVALAASLALPLAAQTAGATLPRSQVSYTQQEDPNLMRLLQAIDTLSQQEKLGQLPPNAQMELNHLRSEFKARERDRQYLLNVEFPGGSLSSLLDAVNADNVASLNVISPGSADLLKAVELPAFSLRNARLATLTKVVGNLVEMQGYKFQIVDDSSPNHFVGMLSKPGQPSAPNTAPAAFESIQLEEYIRPPQTIDTIVDAIRTAWELDPRNQRDALKLKYHPLTKILLVSGPQPAVVIAKQVVGSLRKMTATP